MFLSLVFHNHQPVGQLPWVFDEAHRDAYEPFLDVLEAHPQIKVALHYTGPLLDWLVQHQPRTVERVREMVSRGQVEVLGGGYYEPILAIWPRDDQHAQLQLLSERVLEVFGREPLGAWLAERVWEPSLIASMGDAKLLYTFVDSTVFEAAGVLEKNSLGSFVARDNDKSLGEKSLTVFPINQSLRHRIPWHDAQDSIDYLKTAHERAGAQSLAVFADDGEKFGAWPGTFNFIYNEQWLDKFFTAIEAQSDWLQTVTPREWSSTRDVLGREAHYAHWRLHHLIEIGQTERRFLDEVMTQIHDWEIELQEKGKTCTTLRVLSFELSELDIVLDNLFRDENLLLAQADKLDDARLETDTPFAPAWMLN